jgi:hypothetical protein
VASAAASAVNTPDGKPSEVGKKFRVAALLAFVKKAEYHWPEMMN